MASNLGRVFSAAISQSKPKLELLPPLTRRLISSPSQNHHNDIPDETPLSDDNPPPDHNSKDEGEDEDDGDSLDLNEATGEIGGPRGPEPTRFGDWERNGRCSDF